MLIYKGYAIEKNLYGQGEYTVQVSGDDLWFSSEEEARQAIDEIIMEGGESI